MSVTKSILSQAANEWKGRKFVDDVFRCNYYIGAGGADGQTITNGMNLADDGGMIWIKRQSASNYDHHLWDSEAGLDRVRFPNLTAPDTGNRQDIQFNQNGFSLLTQNANSNNTGDRYGAWTFKKSPNFFDIVVYNGDGTTNRQIEHNLQSAPGMMMVKCIDGDADYWYVYHRGYVSPSNSYTLLNSATGITSNETIIWGNNPTTDTHFEVGSQSGGSERTNALGSRYVAYLFAHNEGYPTGFGENGDDEIIKCGNYTGTNVDVNLGFEPQFLMIKNVTQSRSWVVFDEFLGETGSGFSREDNMGYWPMNANPGGAQPNQIAGLFDVNANGFTITTTNDTFGDATDRFVYMAIRKGYTDRTPTDGTEVFKSFIGPSPYKTGWPVDLLIQKNFLSTGNWQFIDRVRGDRKYITTTQNAAQGSITSQQFDSSTEVSGTAFPGASSAFAFRRAKGFFDIQYYNGENGRLTVPHALGVKPELIIVKNLDTTDYMHVAGVAADNANGYVENRAYTNIEGGDAWNLTTNYRDGDLDNDTEFCVRTNNSQWNDTTSSFIAYLFASCPGVCKVSHVTVTGNDDIVDCGFTSGARFVLIKDDVTVGPWYVVDVNLGFGETLQRELRFSTNGSNTDATDLIRPHPSGFTIPSTSNLSGNCVYIAIA